MYAATSDIERHAHAWQHVYSTDTERHATPTSTPPQPPQSQSGWFPLEGALVLDSSSSTVLGPSQQQQQQQQQQQLRPPPHDMYAAESLLPPLSSDTPGDRWMPSESYVHDPSSRFVQPPLGRPDHPVTMYQPQQQQHAPVYSVHELPTASYAWAPHDDDARFSASHTALSDQFDATYAPDRLPSQPQQHFHPLSGALASPMMRPPLLYQSHYDSSSSMSHLTPPPPPLPLPTRHKAKAITIGRWSADEHKWFLKGLEMFQGPAWGEIARLIGSRTSTQVRTHAQKFFTKLARLNQTLPYFDAQIQRERTRLEALGGSSSVTPTAATSSFSFALSSLSPHKRVSASSTTNCTTGGSMKRDSSYCTSTSASELQSSSEVYQQLPQQQQQQQPRMAVYESHETEHMRASDSSYYHTQDSSSCSTDAYRPKYDADVMSPLLRKPRMYVDSTGYAVTSPPGMPALTLPPPSGAAVDTSFGVASQEQQQPHGSAYASLALARDSSNFDSARLMQFPTDESPMGGYSLLPASSSSDSAGIAADPWSSDDAVQRQWLAAPLDSADSSSNHQVATTSAVLDADSLPSMHKLLFRGSGA